MSREQNIDDILKLLKDSVSTESQVSDSDRDAQADGEMTEEILKKKLKNQYFDREDVSEFIEEPQKEYVLDSDFLDEISQQDENTVQEEEDNAVIENTAVEDDIIENDTVENSDIEDDIIDEEDNDDMLLADESEDELPPDNVDDLIAQLKPIEDTSLTSRLEEEPEVEPEEENEVFEEIQPHGTIDISTLTEESVAVSVAQKEESGADEDAEWDEFVAEETLSESEVTDEDVDAVEAAESEAVAKVQEEQGHETFLASMRKIGLDISDDDASEGDAENDFEHTDDTDNENIASENAPEYDDEPITDDGEIDLSTISLMMQFCDKDELKERLGDQKFEEYLRQTDLLENNKVSAHVFDGNEYVANDQNQKIAEAYKKKRKSTRNTMLGCLALALVTLIFELLPAMNVKPSGLLDYTEYPAVYILAGLQLLAFSAAVCYKSLWLGLKRAFSLSPNRYSLVAVVLGLTALYDLITVIILAFSQDDIPNTFNAIAAITVALCAVADYADIRCEMEAFSVYSSELTKYTVTKDSSPHSVAEKMYAGGLERDKSVYSVVNTDFPKGFFGCVSKKKSRSALLTGAIVAVFILGIISTVVSIIIGADAYSSCAAFMVCLYGILPVSVIFADCVPFALATYKLSKRGTAIAGEGMIDVYGDCDVMVFGDLHMFKKCDTEDVGIAMYDSSVGYLALGCLDALYSRIGGPLSGMQMNLPAAFRFNDVNIRRITRTGVEAIIDKKHILIVGEHSFMQRYGLAFPDDEVKNGRSTLCVSLNGKVTAKLNVRYQTEPVFEMLVERLYSEGICCAIATYDPLINSTMLSAARTIGESPVSVVHRNADDFYADKGDKVRREDNDGVICCSSRLKLAEAEVWIKRLAKVRRYTNKAIIAFSTVGAALLALLIALGLTGEISQFYVLGAFAAELGIIFAIAHTVLPKADHFTVDALYAELEKQALRHQNKQPTAPKKSKNKIKKEN